ncbi:MAG TPA: hypothetical protein VF170_16645, partial [Planctomycetaceae bacterium]
MRVPSRFPSIRGAAAGVLLALAAGSAVAQTPTPAAPPSAADPPGTVRVYLMEGSVVSGTLSVEALTVKTA